ncbi:MAG TPA: hypothetical protein PLR02_07290 [Rhodocyclaceae bacterium]|nr:hypothetical protein [Rhodocyclaceae bacterium]
MRSEFAANLSLSPKAVGAEQRTDWPMRQFVEDMVAILRTHPAHAQVQGLMRDRGVPLAVQRRVLAGA